MLTVRTSSALNSLTQPTRGHPVDPWSGLAQIKNRLPSSSVESQLTAFFFKSQNLLPIASGPDVIFTPRPISYLGFLLRHLWLSHPLRARVDTSTQCMHLTNPRKVLSLTKPKDKIYKTKIDNIKKILAELYNTCNHYPMFKPMIIIKYDKQWNIGILENISLCANNSNT